MCEACKNHLLYNHDLQLDPQLGAAVAAAVGTLLSVGPCMVPKTVYDSVMLVTVAVAHSRTAKCVQLVQQPNTSLTNL